MHSQRPKLLGVVGGTAPPSTIEYYRRFIDGYSRRSGGANPALLITSIDRHRLVACFEANDRTGGVALLSTEVRRLAAGGADYALFAANTPHLYFDEVQAQSPIPLISILEATRSVLVARGFRRVGLLATRFAIEAGIFQRSFQQADIDVVVPDPADIELVHGKYMSELSLGRFEEPTRQMFRDVISRLIRSQRIDAVVLGGTEMPLLLPEELYDGVPMLDTTQIHVDRAIDLMLPSSN